MRGRLGGPRAFGPGGCYRLNLRSKRPSSMKQFSKIGLDCLICQGKSLVSCRTSHCQQAVWIQETYPAPHYGLGVAYAKTGDLKKAITELTRYLELVPEDARAEMLLKQIKGDVNQ